MSEALADRVVRYWKFSIGIWLVLILGATGIVAGWPNPLEFASITVPVWNQVVANGESVRLPSYMPTVRAESLFNQAFPEDRLSSSAVLIFHRPDGQLTESDRSFIENELTPRLAALKSESGTTVTRVRDFSDRHIGQILENRKGNATLIVADLEYDFLDQRNKPTVDRIQQVIDSYQQSSVATIPAGLEIALGGSATVGRDLLTAVDEDASGLQWLPLLIVIGLSLAVYRAPLMALIPVAVVFASLQLSLATLILLAWSGACGLEPFTLLRPFSGLHTFVSIIAYGAGLNYSIFLIARYRGEVDRGIVDREITIDGALSRALQRIGASVIASLGTIACGIGTMLIASFGKYQQVGGAMALTLGITLLCSLTLLPALLRLTGKYAFWPHAVNGEAFNPMAARPVLTSRRGWQFLFDHPLLVWSAVVAILLPFAAIGVSCHQQTSYGLLRDLPSNTTGVKGSLAIEKHFGPGQCGPVTVLLHNPNLDFFDADHFEMIESLIAGLNDKRQEFGIVDIRSLIHPLGLNIETGILARGIAKRHYISTADELAGHVMRFDLLMSEDAFSADSRRHLQLIEAYLQNALPSPVNTGTELLFLGTTASVVDLKAIADRDQIVLDGGVLSVIFLVLIGLLRKVAVPVYLILSVSYVYLVALGMTTVIFWAFDPRFIGIDWKVPLFLFTILVAIGQDYNIFATSRLKEEQATHGMGGGIRAALLSTGSVMSNCGLITAGAFFSLVLVSDLSGSHQLGTALTLGVLLDTFIARRVLFPAWLLMVSSNSVGVRIANPVVATPVRFRELSGSRIVL